MKRNNCEKDLVNYILFLLFTLLIGVVSSSFAAPILYDYPFESYPDIGSINTVMQSSNGMIWIAGQRGLLRYEGKRFKRYGLNEGLNSEYVYSVHERDDGILFACTWRGLHRYNPGEDRWKVLPVRSTEPVRDIHFLNDEMLLATDDGAILVNGMAEYRLPLTDPHVHFHLWGPSYSIAYDEKNDNVYLGTEYHGVVSFPLEKFRPFWKMKDPVLQKEYNAIGRKAYIEKYHADPDSQCAIYVFDTKQKRREFADSLRKSWKTSKQQIPVKKLVFDDDGSIVFSNIDGLFRIKDENLSKIKIAGFENPQQFSLLSKTGSQLAFTNIDGITLIKNEEVSSRIQHDDGLNHGRITAIFRDREKVLWIGTEHGGIQKQVSEAFNRYRNPQNSKVGEVKKALTSEAGIYIIGSKGLASFKQGHLTTLFSNVNENQEIIDAVLDKNGNFLIARTDGLFLLKGREIRRLVSAEVPLALEHCFFSTNEFIWFHSGQETYSWKNGELKHIDLQGKVYLFNSVLNDASGQLFLGTWAGLIRFSNNCLWYYSKNGCLYFDLTDATALDWNVDYHVEDDLVKDDGVLTTAFGPDSLLYMGTLSGGILFYKDEVLNQVQDGDGTPLNGSFPNVFTDSQGSLYFHGNLDVVKLDTSGFRRLEGVNPLQASIRHIVEDASGRKYLVSSRNTTIIENDQARYYIKPDYGFNFDSLVDVVTTENTLHYILRNEIISININDSFYEDKEVYKPVLVSAEISDSSYYKFENLELPLGVRAIEFSFALPSYINEQDHTFSWYLEGVETEYSPWENKPSIKYERLPPGLYTFHLKASSGFGQISTEATPVEFRVLPYFYETVIFAIFATIVGILVIYLIIRLAHWNILRVNSKLEERVTERTRELEDALLELEAKSKSELEAERLRTVQNLAVTISHEFNNPLAILNTAAQLLSMYDKDQITEKPRKIVDRIPPAVERLSRLVERMNNINDVQVGKYADSVEMINFDEDSVEKKNPDSES